MKPRKIPMRMCMGCREMKPKKELVRVVRSPEGVVSLDMAGKKPGRGAYVCPDADCMKKAIKQKQIERMLECKVEPAVLEELQAAVEKAQGGSACG
jgi:Predicted nucleic-acid-binding protein implicated in transcription termination